MSTLEAAAGESPRMTSLGFDAEPYPVGTHMCFIYNDERERWWVMSKYIQSGLEATDQVSYFVDTMSPENLKMWMRGLGVTLPDELDGRQYSVLQAEETYCPDGTFKVERMLDTVGPGAPSQHPGGLRWGPRHRRDDLVETGPCRIGEPFGV